MIHIRFIILTFLLLPTAIYAQLSFFDTQDSSINSYHESIYSYNFDITSDLLSDESIKFKNIDKSLFQVNYFWWLIITGEQNEVNFQQCFSILSEAEDDLTKSQLKTEKDELTALIIYLFKARIHVFNNDYYKALVSYSEMLGMLKSLMKNADEEVISPQTKLVLGLYHYSIGKLKSNYPMFYPYFLLLPKSDFDKGKKWVLESIKSNDILIKTESLYFLMKISLEVDKNYKEAEIFSEQLVKLYSNNLLFQFYRYQIKYHLKKHVDANEIYKEMIQIANKKESLSDNQKTHFINIIKKDFPLKNE
jgi:tetratricopeptide (TPR) repeat protein